MRSRTERERALHSRHTDEDERVLRGLRRDDFRGGFGNRGQFSRLRDQHGHYIDEDQDQRRNRYLGASELESRSPWRGGSYHGDVYRYTSEDDTDRELRGIRYDRRDGRSRQWASQPGDDDMRGQFQRSRDDGELGMRGSPEPRDAHGRPLDDDDERALSGRLRPGDRDDHRYGPLDAPASDDSRYEPHNDFRYGAREDAHDTPGDARRTGRRRR